MNANTYFHISHLETESIIGRYPYVRCAKEIEPFIKKYYKKFRKQNFKKDSITNSKVDAELRDITDILYNLALNTIECTTLEDRELKALESIFNLIYKWFDDVTQKGIFHDRTKFRCIEKILEENRIRLNPYLERLNYDEIKPKMLFEDYEDLYKVIKRIDEEWEDLLKRGFKISVFDDFETSTRHARFSNKKSREEKFMLFMRLLDGELKFMPVYSKVGYEIVPKWKTKKIIRDNNMYPEYCLEEKE